RTPAFSPPRRGTGAAAAAGLPRPGRRRRAGAGRGRVGGLPAYGGSGSAGARPVRRRPHPPAVGVLVLRAGGVALESGALPRTGGQKPKDELRARGFDRFYIPG